jgi:ADP-heptose:LPS heptosyltransferase
MRRLANGIAASGLEAAVRLAALRTPSLRERPQEPRSIFVLRNNDIGDLLVITPLFEALRRRFPCARIAAGVGDWNRDVLRFNPHVSEVLSVNAPWFNKYQDRQGVWDRWQYLRRSPEIDALAERRFEVGIDVLGSPWGSLLLLRARIPYRLGVRGYAGGHTAAQAALDFKPDEHVGKAALGLAALLGAVDMPANLPQIFLAPEERRKAEAWWRLAETDDRKRKRLVVGPGGGLVVKCWPPENWAALARGIDSLDNLNVLLIGGPSDGDLLAMVARDCRRVRVFPSPPDLREAFALVATSDGVVCNSSMLLHVAAAFSKPVLVLLGESFPSAVAHQLQWGYPDLSRSLGREPPLRTALWEPAETLRVLREQLAL